MRVLALSALLFAPTAMAQFTGANLEQNLRAIDCDTVVVVKSNAIRDPIHWSPDSKSIGVKVEGNWVSINLDKLMLKRFKWRNELNVATPAGKPEYVPLPSQVRATWKSATEEESTKLRNNMGTIIEFAQLKEGGVALLVTPLNGTRKEIWRTNLEDCQGLVLSPDHHWVAFICGVHGAVVMKVP